LWSRFGLARAEVRQPQLVVLALVGAGLAGYRLLPPRSGLLRNQAHRDELPAGASRQEMGKLERSRQRRLPSAKRG
jgi:hypothetical protein